MEVLRRDMRRCNRASLSGASPSREMLNPRSIALLCMRLRVYVCV